MTMTMPCEVKFQLERQLINFAKGGPLPLITGVHSVVVEDGAVHVAYDIEGGEDLLLFEFSLPVQTLSRDLLGDFVRWLAEPVGSGSTVH
jgi:hypothetical protein